MPVDPNGLAQYAGKNVNIVITGTFAHLSGEGRIEAASPVGVAFKPKGKGSEILMPADIESIETSAVVKKITRKSMLRCTVENVRQHLVDRHGYKVGDIESMTPEDALAFHDGLAHDELGHDHKKEPAQAEQAAA